MVLSITDSAKKEWVPGWFVEERNSLTLYLTFDISFDGF